VFLNIKPTRQKVALALKEKRQRKSHVCGSCERKRVLGKNEDEKLKAVKC